MHLMILYQSHWTCRIQNRIKILENSRTLDDFIPCQVHLVTIEVLTNPVVSSTFQRRQIQGIQPIPVVTVNRHKFSALDRAIQQATHQELIIHCHLLRTGTPDRTGLVSPSPRPWTSPWTIHGPSMDHLWTIRRVLILISYLGVNSSIGSKGPHYHPYSQNSKSSSSNSKVETQPKSLGSSSLDALNSCVNSLNPAKVSPTLPTAKPKADTTVKTVSNYYI